jgi:hypothetical protein
MATRWPFSFLIYQFPFGVTGSKNESFHLPIPDSTRFYSFAPGYRRLAPPHSPRCTYTSAKTSFSQPVFQIPLFLTRE